MQFGLRNIALLKVDLPNEEGRRHAGQELRSGGGHLPYQQRVGLRRFGGQHRTVASPSLRIDSCMSLQYDRLFVWNSEVSFRAWLRCTVWRLPCLDLPISGGQLVHGYNNSCNHFPHEALQSV